MQQELNTKNYLLYDVKHFKMWHLKLAWTWWEFTDEVAKWFPPGDRRIVPATPTSFLMRTGQRQAMWQTN